MSNFAFYGRVSTTDLQAPEESRRWQRSRADQLIGAEGEIAAEYFDEGQSRTTPWKRRPEATRLLADLRNRNRGWDAVVIAEPSRAFAGIEFGLIFPIMTHWDVGLWVPEVGGLVDPGSEAHDLVMSLFSGMAKGERNRIKVRTRSSMEAMAAVGLYTGGCPPYGLQLRDLGEHVNPQKKKDGKRRWGFEVDPYAAVIVAEMFERYAAGDGLGQIATDLTNRGILSPSAYRPEYFPHRREGHGAWSRSAVRAILKNPTYIGKTVYGRLRRAEVLRDSTDAAQGYETRQRRNEPDKWVWADEETHPPIVDAAAYEAVQARFLARQNGKGPRALAKGRQPYALRGLIFCVTCEEALGTARRMYHCEIGKGAKKYRYACCRLQTAEYARNPALEASHPRFAYLREDRVIPVLDDYIARSFDPANAEQTARALAAVAADEAEIARHETQAEQWRRKLADATGRKARYKEALDSGLEMAVAVGFLNEADADIKQAQAELGRLAPVIAPTSAELLAAIEELRDHLAGIAAADDPHEKNVLYRRLGVRVEWAPGSPDVNVTIAPTRNPDGGVTFSGGDVTDSESGGGGVCSLQLRAVLPLAA